jgi:hypothetical protein
MPAKVERLSIFCADIGSQEKGNFGWAGVSGGHSRQGRTLQRLVDAVAQDLRAGLRVALGFECPTFVPLRDDPKSLTKVRDGETNPNWIGGPGPPVLATGIVQVHWILRTLFHAISPKPPVYLEWVQFAASNGGLFLWEAFVSGDAKGSSHVADARNGLRAFRKALPNPETANAITGDCVISLTGLALLHSGWLTDLSVLHKRCLVIRA